jgi:hypothetical protein
LAIAPHPEEFPKLLDQMGAYMRKSYDWSADVKKLTMPVMLIFGDSDMYRPEHVVKFYQLKSHRDRGVPPRKISSICRIGSTSSGWMARRVPL